MGIRGLYSEPVSRSLPFEVIGRLNKSFLWGNSRLYALNPSSVMEFTAILIAINWKGGFRTPNYFCIRQMLKVYSITFAKRAYGVSWRRVLTTDLKKKTGLSIGCSKMKLINANGQQFVGFSPFSIWFGSPATFLKLISGPKNIPCKHIIGM